MVKTTSKTQTPKIYPNSVGGFYPLLNRAQGTFYAYDFGPKCPYHPIWPKTLQAAIESNSQESEIFPDNILREFEGLIQPLGVFIGHLCEPFSLNLSLRKTSVQMIEWLTGKGIKVWVQTRGILTPEEKAVLVQQTNLVRLVIPISALNVECCSQFEPNAPSPQDRISQIKTLIHLGLDTQVEFGPIIPGINDGKEMQLTLEAIAKAGVKKVSLHCLAMNPMDLKREILRRKGKNLKDLNPWIKGKKCLIPGYGVMQLLSTATRGRLMGKGMNYAKRVGLNGRVNGILNPDFLLRPLEITPPSNISLKEKFLALTSS